MARYYFHVIDGLFQPDSVGEEFKTLTEARAGAAARVAKSVISRADRFWDNGSFRLVVTDVEGNVLFEMSGAGQTHH